MKRTWILLLIIILIVYGCRQNNGHTYLGKDFAERYLTLQHIFHGDGPQKAVLDSLMLEAVNARDGEAILYIKVLSFGIDARGERVTDSEAEAKFLELANEAEDHGWHYLQVYALQAAAYTLCAKENKGKGHEYYTLAYKQYKDLSLQQFPPKMIFLRDYAASFYAFGEVGVAKQIMAEAISVNDTTDKGMYVSTINSMAMMYGSIGQYDSALILLKHAASLAENDSLTEWTGIIDGNIGLTYFKKGDYERAETLLKTNIGRSLELRLWMDAAEGMNILARLYDTIGRYDEAQALGLSARIAIKNRPGTIPYNVAGRTYRLLSGVYRHKQQYALALLYKDSVLLANDSVHALYDKHLLEESRRKMDAELYAKDAEHNEKLNRYIRNTLLCGIGLLIIIALMAVKNERVKYHRKQERLIREKEAAEEELRSASQKLREFTQNIREKNELIQHVQDELDNLKQLGEQEADIEVLTQLQRFVILTDEQWLSFTGLFEKVHAGFLARLRKSVPDLTPADIRFAALTRLDLSQREMAAMLGVSYGAIRMNKVRLKRKLNITEDSDVDTFIRSI